MRLLFLAVVALFISNQSRADFGAHIGGHFSYGNMGSKEAFGGNQTRPVGTIDFQAMPGLQLLNKSLLLGPLLDIRFHSDLSNDGGFTPYSGHGYLLGLGFVYQFAVGKFLFSYDLRDRHFFSAPETTYKGTGFHFLFGYRIMGDLFVDLQYVIANYGTRETTAGEVKISGDEKISHKSLGAGLSWMF